jgi:hypothetical protein
VTHITAECLDQFAPERVAHFAAESVAGLLRNMQRFKVIALGMIVYLLNPLILHGGNSELTKRTL